MAQREESLAKQLAGYEKTKEKTCGSVTVRDVVFRRRILSSYVPSFGWEMAPPSDKQKNTLEKLGNSSRRR